MKGRAPGLAAALLLACLRPRTQIVVLVDTDMPQGPGATLTHVRVTVRSLVTGVVRQRATYALRLAAGPHFELPGTLGIAALDNDGSRSVEVSVDAVHDAEGDGTTAAPVFTSTTVAPSEEQQTRLLRVFLADRCRALAARCDDDSTCTAEGCAPRRVPALPEVSPDFIVEPTMPLAAFDAPAPAMPTTPVDAAAPVDVIVRPDAPAPVDVIVRPDAPAPLDVAAPDRPVAVPDRAVVDVVRDVARDAFDAAETPLDRLAPDVALDRAPPTPPCATGLTRCGVSCVDLRASMSHCGRCNNACAPAPRATARCVEGACALTCSDDRVDCDGDPRNGCELRPGTRCDDREPCADRVLSCVAREARCRRVPFACGTPCGRNAVCDLDGACVAPSRARCDGDAAVDASPREDAPAEDAPAEDAPTDAPLDAVPLDDVPLDAASDEGARDASE